MMEAHWKRYQQLETENQALRDSLIHFCDVDRERLGQGVGAFSECPLCSILRLEAEREQWIQENISHTEAYQALQSHNRDLLAALERLADAFPLSGAPGSPIAQALTQARAAIAAAKETK